MIGKYCLLIVFFLGSCVREVPEQKCDVRVLDVETAWKNLKVPQMKLSSFVDSITYIFLEGTDTTEKYKHRPFLFWFTDLVRLTDRYVFLDKSVFDFQGSRLPVELPYAMSAYSDALGGYYRIDSASSSPPLCVVGVYGIDGERIRQIPLSVNDVWGLEVDSEGHLLLCRRFDFWEGPDTSFYEFRTFDVRTGKELYVRKSSEFREGDRDMLCTYYLVNPNSFWSCKKRDRYYETITDTVYSIENGRVGEPVYVLSGGQYRPSFSRMREEQGVKSEDEYMSFTRFIECDPYLFFMAHYRVHSRYVYYNKCDSSLYVYKSPYNAMYNDVDGIPVGRFLGATSDGDLYDAISADYLCKHRDKLDDSSLYKARIDRVTDMDNPVIRIFHVRKNIRGTD